MAGGLFHKRTNGVYVLFQPDYVVINEVYRLMFIRKVEATFRHEAKGWRHDRRKRVTVFKGGVQAYGA